MLDNQEPQLGIAKISEDVYRVNCECTSNDHSVDCWIEVEQTDDEIPDLISISHYVTMYSKYNENIWDRIKSACNILFKGVDTKEHEIILKGEAAENWLNAIAHTVEKSRK